MFNDAGSGMYMPVAPAQYGYGGGNGMFGDSGWFVLLIILAAFGGFGNGFGGNGGGQLYPWMNQAQMTQSGFNDIQLSSALSALQASVSNGFAQAEVGSSNRQMALMQQLFGLQNQFNECCCENRLATERLGNAILQDGGSTRQVLNDGFRDLQASQLAGFQRVLDTMCNYQIQAKDEKIADLQRQLGEANNARLMENLGNRIVANNEAQTTTLEQYLAPKANPAWIVQNPNCCGNQSPYNCGCSYN